MNKIETTYSYLRIAYISLFILTFLGLGAFAPRYMMDLEIVIKLIISLYLMATFNIFVKKTTISKHEKSMVFTAGVYLFLTTSLGYLILNYIKKIGDVHESPFVKFFIGEKWKRAEKSDEKQ